MKPRDKPEPLDCFNSRTVFVITLPVVTAETHRVVTSLLIYILYTIKYSTYGILEQPVAIVRVMRAYVSCMPFV